MTTDADTAPDWWKNDDYETPEQYAAGTVDVAVDTALVAFKRGFITSKELQRTAIDVLELLNAAELWTKKQERFVRFPPWLANSARELD